MLTSREHEGEWYFFNAEIPVLAESRSWLNLSPSIVLDLDFCLNPIPSIILVWANPGTGLIPFPYKVP